MTLRKHLAAKCGKDINHGQALNAIATLVGMNEWNTLKAALNQPTGNGLKTYTLEVGTNVLVGPRLDDTEVEHMFDLAIEAVNKKHAEAIGEILAPSIVERANEEQNEETSDGEFTTDALEISVTEGATKKGKAEMRSLLDYIEEKCLGKSLKLGATTLRTSHHDLQYGRVFQFTGPSGKKTFHAFEFLKQRDRTQEFAKTVIDCQANLNGWRIEYGEDYLAIIPPNEKLGESDEELYYTAQEWYDDPILVFGAFIGKLATIIEE